MSLALALVPLALSALGGYVLLNHGVIAAFKDVAYRQGRQIVPTQHLRLSILDSLGPVDEYVEGGDATRKLMYRGLRKRIETEFAALGKAMRAEPGAKELIERALADWTAADQSATALISARPAPGDPQTVRTIEQFHGRVAAAADRLSAAYEQLSEDIEDDHQSALLYYERSLWLAGIAAGLSLLTAIAGVLLFGRIISGSVDRLVDGAYRFAEGDRSHRIEVEVPPELHRVAEEFNRMAGRVNQSEELLGDLAHRDGLTHLLNRRAFDDALAEMLARARRFGEEGAIIALDVDHFKQINDTYGHAAGDEVLRVIAETMMSQLRPFDKVFRTGGEEFAVLLASTDIVSATETAERLRLAIKSHTVRFKDEEIAVTVSAGVAAAVNGADGAKLAEAVDSALYKAKKSGRDRVVVSGGDRTRDAA